MSKRKIEKPVVDLPPPKRSSKWIAIIVAVALALAGVAYWKLRIHPPEAKQQIENKSPEEILKDLSLLSYTGMEPQVTTKLKQLIEDTRKNSGSAHSWGKLAMNLDIHDLKKESIPCYKIAQKLNPQDFRWPYYCAIVLEDQGSSEALPMFAESVKLKPAYTAAHLRYGQSLLKAKRYSEAAQEFQQALSINPASAHANVGLAQVSLAQNDLKASMTYLGKALQSNPRFGEAHSLVAEIYRRANRPEDANRQSAISQQLPKVTPVPDEIYLELIQEGVSSYWYDSRGRAYLQERLYDDAIRELKQAVAITPDPRLYNTLGAAYLSTGKLDLALEQHQKALALNPTSVPTLNNLASTLYELGRTDEAFKHLKKAIELEPSKPYSYLHLTRLYVRSGKNADAIETLKLGGGRIPTSPQIAIQLAWLLSTSRDASLRDGPEAVRLADNVCKVSEYRDPEALDVLSAAFAEAGRFDLAKQSAQKAIEIAGKSDVSKKIQQHLNYYESGKPFRE